MSEKKRQRRSDAGHSASVSGAGKKKPRPANSHAQDLRKHLKPDSDILSSLREMYDAAQSSSSSSATLTLADLNLSSAYREVSDRDADVVRLAIERAVLDIARSVLAGRGFSFDVPSRAASNQLYVPELDRIVLRDKSSARPFANLATVRKATVRKATVTARVLSLVYSVLLRGIHVTKRDLFYTDVKLFQDQSQSDAVLDDVSCMLGCTRSSLHVVASEKGVVVGRLVFTDDGDRIDCTKMGIGGKAIPPNLDRVGNLESDALFIPLVEKDAAFMRLAEDRFYNRCSPASSSRPRGSPMSPPDSS